jgi:RsiW-degrading membrane proteinase PrsW (M82 family)
MTDVLALREAQAEAIAESGWGRPFRVIQLRNACFWVLLWGLVAGATRMVQQYGSAGTAYATGLGVGIVAFAIYTVPWLLLLSHLNRFTAVPAKALLVAFLWGFFAATFWLGLPANEAILGLYNKAFGHTWTADWGAGLTAPITEETVKALAVVLLIGLAPHLVRSAYDGLIIGAFSGLGLQISEDILYAFNASHQGFGADQVGASLGILQARGFAGLFQHVLFSAIFCAGLVWLLGREGGRHRVRGALLMVGAMAVHGSWDDMGTLGITLFGAVGPLIMFVISPVAGLLLLRQTFVWAGQQEHAWLRAILAPEAAQAVLTEAEVDAIAGTRKARRRFLKAADDRRQAKHLLEAGLDLGRTLAESGGRDTDDVDFARAEVTRVRAG